MVPVYVRTIGEMLNALAELPRDLPLYQRVNIGNWTQTVHLEQGKLAIHKTDTTYVADLTDPVWETKKDTFGPEFPVLVVS